MSAAASLLLATAGTPSDEYRLTLRLGDYCHRWTGLQVSGLFSIISHVLNIRNQSTNRTPTNNDCVGVGAPGRGPTDPNVPAAL